ncbi:MAG: ribbon-helix-helix domain-containing protein [Acidimicrobiaceae bacterium]|nr:ribbon-helix-helix domain-containing protein [Acidimicrobiaceae bacterium]MCY4174774.1 ribbon-helix-helix domain-containing protein [Acidimicrobiaceae bacterium]MCY4279540.1 ribbon-helix-helix domain-containing protein [Acidimicrobiaceae bacterium]MCY4295026.1 ribbon-helix-helix domain-containing protein [Acidimicrobiaceae bacterium]
MKLSVSIPDGDVAFLDEYAKSRGMASRSAALHRAIRLLRTSELAQHYAAAFVEWEDSDEDCAWDSAVADGLQEIEA